MKTRYIGATRSGNHLLSIDGAARSIDRLQSSEHHRSPSLTFFQQLMFTENYQSPVYRVKKALGLGALLFFTLRAGWQIGRNQLMAQSDLPICASPR